MAEQLPVVIVKVTQAHPVLLDRPVRRAGLFDDLAHAHAQRHPFAGDAGVYFHREGQRQPGAHRQERQAHPEHDCCEFFPVHSGCLLFCF